MTEYSFDWMTCSCGQLRSLTADKDEIKEQRTTNITFA
jgi:hypothetical protein